MTRVAESAHYVTPDGTVIREGGRMDVISQGQWTATKVGPPKRRGYHLNAFYSPLENGRFGKIAVEFLTAKQKGPRHLRTFVYEYLGEPWIDEAERVEAGALDARCADYGKGEMPETFFTVWIPKEKCVLVTADVQKTYLAILAREWVADCGDSGLIDWQFAPDFETLEAFATQFRAVHIGIDIGYAARAMEVYDYAMSGPGIVPLRGSESLQVPLKRLDVDPYEGKVGQGRDIVTTYVFNTDIFKSWLQSMQKGEAPQKWWIYRNPEREYLRQVTAEERVNGKWNTKPGQSQNHLFDCCVGQLVLATVSGLVKSNNIQTEAIKP
ncbi:MAG TPA: phage terminase large subunit family protein [Kiritimatiellia bacterium]|nr:phage terminase large subunit family protein [Kiritimatiellia bacterium]